MLDRRQFGTGLAATGILSLCGCNPIPAFCRIRLSLEIVTPAGVQRGSTIIKLTAREQFETAMGRKYILNFSGEAIAFNIAGDVIFATLYEGLAGALLGTVVQEKSYSGPVAKVRQVRAMADDERIFDLKPADYPSLVRFRDRSDPATIQAVCIRGREEGEDCSIRIQRAFATPTLDDQEELIERHLPWIDSFQGSLVKAKPQYLQSPEQNYNNDAFRR